MRIIILLTLVMRGARSFTPYTPTVGWTYYLEAARQQNWPECTNRFMSIDSHDTKVSLSSNADSTAEFTLEASNNRDAAFYLKLSNGKYLSYAGPCNELQVDTWPEAGINQEFRFIQPKPTPAPTPTPVVTWKEEPGSIGCEASCSNQTSCPCLASNSTHGCRGSKTGQCFWSSMEEAKRHCGAWRECAGFHWMPTIHPDRWFGSGTCGLDCLQGPYGNRHRWIKETPPHLSTQQRL